MYKPVFETGLNQFLYDDFQNRNRSEKTGFNRKMFLMQFGVFLQIFPWKLIVFSYQRPWLPGRPSVTHSAIHTVANRHYLKLCFAAFVRNRAIILYTNSTSEIGEILIQEMAVCR